MKFSDIYNITDARSAEWFDPILSVDSPLSVDPFLIYDNERDEFVGAHDEIVNYFASLFERVGRNSKSSDKRLRDKVARDAFFPEVKEFCLGFTRSGTDGSGSGATGAHLIIQSIEEALAIDRTNFNHFEEIQLFKMGVGPDLISDTVGNILFKRFADYTERVAGELGLKCETFPRSRLFYDHEKGRWKSGPVRLPANPYYDHGVILIPKRYLRKLPNVNAKDYVRFCKSEFPEALADEFGDDIISSLGKAEIVSFATKHPDTRQAFLDFLEKTPLDSYDFDKDELGFWKFWDASRELAEQSPVLLGHDEFIAFLNEVIRVATNSIENEGSWRLLWNENKSPKSEASAQALFFSIIKHYCAANNIEVTKEANIGRGPVDFKVSHTTSNRVLIEAKLVKNSRFWNGLKQQLPKYMEAEGIEYGIFLVFAFNDKELQKVSDIENIAKDVSKQTGYDITVSVIDASYGPISASKLI